MKPKSLTTFDYVFLGSIIVDIFVIMAGWDWVLLEIHNETHLSGGGPDVQEFMGNFAPWAFAVGFGITFCLWALVSVVRVAFFRYILLILTFLEVASVLLEIVIAEGNFYFTLAAALTAGMRALSMIFLFNQESVMWIRREI